MLLLPAAALCCLCSALLTTAEDLIQEDLTLTRRVGGQVSLSCGQTHRCDSDYIRWYQKKDTETFKMILYIDKSNGNIGKGYNHPQEADFSAVNKGNGCELQIQRVKLSHSATYYCSCLKSASGGSPYYIFGSGTKLFVGDEPVVKPVVSVYPAAPRAQLEGKSSLLCVASDMFPPLVQISWKRQQANGRLELLPPADSEMFRKSGCTVSVLKLQQREESSKKYVCSVKHEGGTEQDEINTLFLTPAKSTSGPPEMEPTKAPAPPIPRPPDTEPTGLPALPALQQTDCKISIYYPLEQTHSAATGHHSSSTPISFQSQCRVKLLSVLYSLLIVKSLVYCCGLSLLRILTN
ncbi:immunoglobulin lambda-1 light chain-like [Halichoeres trimaculatus]|uniref:immunoglobulin lambda-1 light chain-like n=1 Tax=Halichoeres trimaculatus TaxID=147232 RepID=UPI003D9E5360